MKLIKKFTAIKLSSESIDNRYVKINLTYGDVTGPYYSKVYPEEEYDTEKEAIDGAYNLDKYATWLILPIIRFNIYE